MTKSRNIRKKRVCNGSGSTQKHFTFRIDNELLPWLDGQPNKGRYINNLIHQDVKSKSNAGQPSDMSE